MPYDLTTILWNLVVYGGGSVAVLFLIIRFLARHWVNEFFAKRLEEFRHEQAKELQRMRVEVESLLSGALKLQEREFTVLPEAWNRLSEAFVLAQWVASPLQTYVDIFSIEHDQFVEYLQDSEHPESEKRRLRELRDSRSSESEREAFRIISTRRRFKATKAVGELQQYLLTHGLFLPRPIKEHFEKVARCLQDGLYFLGEISRPGDAKRHEQASAQVKEATTLRTAIEMAIEKRLHSHGRSAAG